MPQSSLIELLELESAPVAITFVDRPPAGVPRCRPQNLQDAGTGAALPPGRSSSR